LHRCRRQETRGAHVPPNLGKKYLSGSYVKFGNFVTFEQNIKIPHFDNFYNYLGEYHVKFGHFDNCSYPVFSGENVPPLKLTQLLHLCIYAFMFLNLLICGMTIAFIKYCDSASNT